MALITVKFEGDDKQQKADRYFERYRPEGYWTEIIIQDDKQIVIQRNSSCD
jgi:hypothetical protein